MGPWVGEPRRVPTPGTKVPRARGGALHSRTGRWVSLGRARRRQEECLAFLGPLLVAEPQGPMGRIVDHGSSHTAPAVTVGLEAHPRLPGCEWPPSGSPVTPVARSGRRLQTMLAPHRWYGSIQVFLQTVEAFFTAMTPEHALKWAAA
jgi:hypothetical protein